MQREFIATLDWIEAALGAKDKAKYLSKWQTTLAKPSVLLDGFSFLPDPSAITPLPPLSFMLHIPFRLEKPYISKDDRDFYLLDNPLRREKVFQVPMVAATSWKGALRAALWQLGYKEDSAVTTRLLGSPRGSEEGQAGRLYFYPTFFDRVGLEVINPHNRKTGVGERGPILMECVPQERRGDFVLLYVPFGPVGQSEDERRAEVAQDLEMLAKGVQAMLTIYGFGAKTSSGYGAAEDGLAGAGKLLVRAKLAGEDAAETIRPEPEKPSLPRYLEAPGRLVEDLRRADGSLKSEEEYQALLKSLGQQYGKKDRQLYKKARKWWEREGRKLWEGGEQPADTEPEPAPPETLPVTEYTFHTLSELYDRAQGVAAQLREEMGGGA